MLTDVPGILDKKGNLISQADIASAQKLIKNGTISGGMIPKVETCINTIKNNVEAAHILDGRVPHVILLEIFTALGTGSMIKHS
jgi:acetylglutamate kinase